MTWQLWRGGDLPPHEYIDLQWPDGELSRDLRTTEAGFSVLNRTGLVSWRPSEHSKHRQHEAEMKIAAGSTLTDIDVLQAKLHRANEVLRFAMELMHNAQINAGPRVTIHTTRAKQLELKCKEVLSC